MNPILAAGLFDSPWLVAVIIIVSALANWLSKRREEKQANRGPEGDEPTTSPAKPPGEFNLEEALRRLLGEPPKAEVPAPPPIAHAPRGELPSEPRWREEEPFQPEEQTVPSLRPSPPISAPRGSVTTTAVSEQLAQAARRFELLNERGRHPATVVGRHGYRSRTVNRAATKWRDPRSARRAFVASLVFAPPKGLEP